MVQRMFDRCCGCSACESSCPVGAIKLQPDANGFYKPTVDERLCTHCGACLKVCPVETLPEGQLPKAFYACRAKDDGLVSTSSSGGIFPLLAQQILDEGGSVFGCAWASDGMAEHIQITDSKQISRLTTSKYLQSRVGDIFLQVKQQLRTGRRVLFCGTPCQIAGLRRFLRKPYPGLITVDFICHGVPSPKAFLQYKKELELKYGASVQSVCFRDKTKGWNQLQLTVTFENGKQYSMPAAKDSYYRAFLANLSLNQSCGECRFNTLPRLSDLTLGDYWNVEKHHKEFADDAGVSCVVINTESGMALFEGIENALQKVVSSRENIIDGNPFLNGHCTLHKRRKQFFNNLCKEPFSQLAENCLKPTRMEWLKEVIAYKFGRK